MPFFFSLSYHERQIESSSYSNTSIYIAARCTVRLAMLRSLKILIPAYKALDLDQASSVTITNRNFTGKEQDEYTIMIGPADRLIK